MVEQPQIKFFEQKITKKVSINNGESDVVSIKIPKDVTALLKGYGYSWTASSTFQLDTGNITLPKRKDQEGSPTQPMIYGEPLPMQEGGELRLYITNDSGNNSTYDVVFYILTTRFLPEESDGGELAIPTTGSSTGVATNVSIQNPSGLVADVVARGDGKNALVVDTELNFHADNVTLDNVFTASTDGAASGAGYMKIDADGNLLTKNAGGLRTASHSSATIGTSSTAVLVSNSGRNAITIVNIGSEVVYLKLDGTAAALEEGVPVFPNGSVSLDQSQGNVSAEAINAICESGGQKLLVTEW